MTRVWCWTFQFVRLGVVFAIYIFFTIVGLTILKASYFWRYGIVHLNNGTYISREYDLNLDRNSYNIHRLRDNMQLAWDVEFICFNDRGVHVNLRPHRKEIYSGEYSLSMESDLFYSEGKVILPKEDGNDELLRSQVSLVDENGKCLGFCSQWLPISYLTDFRDRSLLRISCGPLPRWLSRFHERPRR